MRKRILFVVACAALTLGGLQAKHGHGDDDDYGHDRQYRGHYRDDYDRDHDRIPSPTRSAGGCLRHPRTAFAAITAAT
jgi:hypothetical protein